MGSRLATQTTRTKENNIDGFLQHSPNQEHRLVEVCSVFPTVAPNSTLPYRRLTYQLFR